jgi:hypothetical protein
MADENSTNTEAATVVETGIITPAEAEKMLGDGGKKALTEERTARKAAEQERDAHSLRLKEYEDRDKSETVKQAERTEAAEKRADAADRLLLQTRTALRHGLSEDESSDMSWSGTDEDIDARAKRVVERRVAAVAPPRGAVDQGSRGDGTAGPAQLTESDLKSMTPAQIVKAQNEGRLNDLLGIKH